MQIHFHPKFYFLLVFLSFAILQTPIFCQTTPVFNFENINTTNGLSNNNVHSIIQDRFGFIWMGTNDGLCRYDGPERIKVFRAGDEEELNTLQSSRIRSLFFDSKDNLWIGTRLGGLTRYHSPTGEWKTFMHDSKNPSSISNDEILCTTEDAQGQIWVGTENGLGLFDEAKSSFISFLPKPGDDSTTIKSKAVLTIMQDSRGWIWIGTWAGGLHLLLPSKDGDFTKSRFKNFQLPGGQRSQNVWKVFEDREGRMWVGTHGGGLHLMQLPTEANNEVGKQNWEPRFHTYTMEGDNNLSHNTIQDIVQDQIGNIWVATMSGINQIKGEDLPDSKIYNKITTQRPKLYFHTSFFNPKNPKSIVGNNICSLLGDQQGLVWAGTNSGVSYLNELNNKFEMFELFDYLEASPNSQNLYLDKKGMGWLGNGDDGLLKYDFEKNKIEQVEIENFSFKNNGLTSIYSEDNLHLYIGSSMGITVLNMENMQAKQYPTPSWLEEEISELVIKRISRGAKNHIWIAIENGLLLLNEEDESYQLFVYDSNNSQSISDNSVTDVLKDSNGNIWVSTYNGLNRIVENTSGKITFERFNVNPQDTENSIASNQLSCLKELSGILYIGSTNGLCGYDLEEKQFLNFSKSANKYNIRSFLINNESSLWASTTEGLFSFDVQEQTFNLYEKSDGLFDLSFREGACGSDEKGNLYFGSRTGITRVNPNAIISNKTIPPVYITDIRKMSPQHKVKINGVHQDEIIMHHDDYFLSFEFTALNYNRPEKNKYAYKLEGFDKSWIYSDANSPVAYTNLHHGEYTFRVKAANNDGVWNETGAGIKIIKKPAFWETCWFMYSCILLLLFGIKSYNKRVNQQNVKLQKYNQNLNKEITERKRVEAALVEKEQYMEQLVEQRTEELKVKNKEVKLLLRKMEERNGALESIVQQRTHKLERSNQDLVRSNKDLEQFAYIASHDLQEPLRIVANFVGVLRKKYSSQMDQKANHYIDLISSAAARMNGLIVSLLTYSRVGRDNVDFQEVQLHQVLECKLLDLSRVIEERQASVQVNQLPEVFCEKNQLGMLFYNLINNGIKFNKSDRPAIIISFHEDEAGYWKFSVADNGIGIPPEYQAKIFQIFSRLHNQEDYQGTGIGLSLCQKIVNRHGGRIWVESEKGEGTTFFFTIDKNLEARIEEEQNDLVKQGSMRNEN